MGVEILQVTCNGINLVHFGLDCLFLNSKSVLVYTFQRRSLWGGVERLFDTGCFPTYCINPL